MTKQKWIKQEEEASFSIFALTILIILIQKVNEHGQKKKLLFIVHF